MLVAICDDAQETRDQLKAIVFAYKAQRRLHIDVYEFSSGDELLRSSKKFDIVFLTTKCLA